MAIIGELFGSPIEGQEWSGAFRSVAKYRVAWADRYTEANSFLSWPRNAHPNKAGVFARNVDISPDPGKIDGEGGSDQYAVYEFAILTVEYRTISGFIGATDDPQDVGPEGTEILVSESIEPATEFQLIPTKGLRWVSDSKDVPDNMVLGRLECESVYTLTRYHWNPSDAVFKEISETKGKVNLDTVTPFTFNYPFPAETLLFIDPSYQREWRDDGSGAVAAGLWTATFRFGVKDGGGGATWNSFWRPNKVGGAGYDRIVHEETGAADPYKKVAFENIFYI